MIAVRPDGVYDISRAVATMSELVDLPDPASFVRGARGKSLGPLAPILSNSDPKERREEPE